MNVTYISSFDATDIGSYSGTGYYIPKKLTEAGDEVSFIGNLSDLNPVHHRAKRKLYQMMGKKYLIDRNPKILQKWANHIQKRIPRDTQELIAYSSLPFSLLKTDKPMVFWADAVMGNMIDYYDVYSNLCNESRKDSLEMEKAALENVTLAVYSSDWAARAAIDLFHIPPSKVKVVAYGANIDVDLTPDDIERRVGAKSKDTCNLLFIGVEWYRKGGDIAVQVAEALNQAGIHTQLSIVGVEVDDELKSKPFINAYGFISKSTKEGQSLLKRLISEAHFLILPSRADCTPIVFNEFNAHGIPVITTNEGGIPSIIKDGVNGCLFDKDAPLSVYVQQIYELMGNHEKYIQLCKSAYNEYQTRLNWKTAIAKFRELLMEII